MRLLALGVVSQAARIDAHLLGDPRSDDLGYLGRAGEERAQEPYGAQLHRETEAVVIAAAAIDRYPVALIEVKEPLQLRRRRRLAVAAVARELTAGEKVDRHPGL